MAKKTAPRATAQANARAQQAQQARTRRAKAAFLKAFARRGIVLRACLAAHVGRRTLYDWLKADPAFKARYDETLEDAIDLLEDEVLRRAKDGVLEPVFQGGIRVGAIRKYSDTLAALVLKGRRAEIYNRERHEHSGPNGGPIPLDLIDAARSSLQKKLEQLSARAGGGPA